MTETSDYLVIREKENGDIAMDGEKVHHHAVFVGGLGWTDLLGTFPDPAMADLFVGALRQRDQIEAGAVCVVIPNVTGDAAYDAAQAAVVHLQERGHFSGDTVAQMARDALHALIGELLNEDDDVEPEEGGSAVYAYTDYPMIALGDISGQEAPIRRVRVLAQDGDKYVLVETVDVEEGMHPHRESIKLGYCYVEPGRSGEVRCVDWLVVGHLPHPLDLPE